VPPIAYGLSAAGYRVEGGFNGPGEPANQWTAWERAGKVAPAPRAGCGIWSDPEQMLRAAEEAGAQALALSVEWARVEPAPGRTDGAALERYASILASVADRGLTPIAVLHDVAHPAWLGEELWLTPGSPDRFADHVGRVARTLAPSCRHWVTLRQPNVVALAGWVLGRYPPRRLAARSDAWAVLDNLLSAHLLAYEALHDLQPGAEVLLGLRASPIYECEQLLVDVLCAPALGVERAELDSWVGRRRACHDAGLTPSGLVELACRRAAAATAPFGSGVPVRPTPRRAVDLLYARRAARPGAHAYPLDSLLVGWPPLHPRAGLAPLPGARAPWEEPPDPSALARWCRRQGRATPGLPVWVEDRFATRRREPRRDGWDETAYVRAELEALGTVADVDVRGYLRVCAGASDPTWPDADFGLGTSGFRPRD